MAFDLKMALQYTFCLQKLFPPHPNEDKYVSQDNIAGSNLGHLLVFWTLGFVLEPIRREILWHQMSPPLLGLSSLIFSKIVIFITLRCR